MSTLVFDDHVERGEEVFRTEHLTTLDRILEAAAILQPRFVRLIAGKLDGAEAGPTVPRLKQEHP
jgi:hypothetical protein